MARKFKKVDGGHGHHGGAWKVAYADFVTAMMALFMVLWLLASTDQQTRQEISNYFRTGILPDGDLSMNPPAPRPPPALPAGLAGGMRTVRVQITEDGIVSEAADEARGLLFDVSSARLNEPLERFL